MIYSFLKYRGRFISVILWLTCVFACAQELPFVYVVKNPVLGKYGFAKKEQNINSPLHGATSGIIKLLGSAGSVLISKENVENIDWAIPPQYDEVSDFSENLAEVRVKDKVGFIDIRNRFVIEPKYEMPEKLGGFKFGLAAVKINGKYGFIDKKGTLIINSTYDFAEDFDENLLAVVKMNGKFGAIDVGGNLVVPYKYAIRQAMIIVPISNKEYRNAAKDAKSKKESGAFDDCLNKLNATSGAVNKQINESLKKQELTYTNVSKGDSLGISDQFGRVIVPVRYKSIVYDKDDRIFIVSKDAMEGAYLYDGTKLVPPCFDSMTEFSNKQSTVEVKGVKGWIDVDGKLDSLLLFNMASAGIALEKANKSDEARALYERILLINPEYASAYNNIALLDIARKDYNSGMRKLKLACKLAPDDTLFANNLKWAKDDRSERRKERWAAGLSIAGAVVGAASTAYSTYSAIKGGTPTASAGSMGTTETSSSSGGFDSSTDKNAAVLKEKSQEQSKQAAWLRNNYQTMSNAYGNYESQIIDLVYNHQDQISRVPAMQHKMREIRLKIVSNGGVQVQSSWETWRK